MNDPKDGEPLARISITLLDEANNMQIDIEGGEKQLARMLASMFGQYPHTINAFDIARRAHKIFKNRKN